MDDSKQDEIRSFIFRQLEAGPVADADLEIAFIHWNENRFHLDDLKAELSELLEDRSSGLVAENHALETSYQGQLLGHFIYKTVFSNRDD